MPLFVEQLTASPTLPVLQATLTLTAPAALERINGDCGGRLPAMRLYVDGRPLGPNGASGSAGSNVGLFVGTIPGLSASVPYVLYPATTPDGQGSHLPVSPIGAPDASELLLYLYPDTTTISPQCFFNLVFRAL